MANIASPGWNNKVAHAKWNTEPTLYGPQVAAFVIPGSGSVTYYDGQAVGRNSAGTICQCDDTAKVEFVGIHVDAASPNYTTVSAGDTAGFWTANIKRDYAFKAQLANAAKGIEGQKCWWLYNNQVALSGLTNWNFAGTILSVAVAATAGWVWVLAPWLDGVLQGGDKGVYSAAAAASTTLTKFDVNKIVLLPLTSSETIYLPNSAVCSPGDRITFINTSANTSTPTISPPATGAGSTDTINGSATYTMSTAQFSVVLLRTDGAGSWYVEVPGPSGTVGATTFSGNVAVSSATLTVTDNSANTFDVGPNGATNPTLQVDTSTASAATGIKLKSAADAAGFAMSVISTNTNEALLIDAKGSGLIKIGTVSTGGCNVRIPVATVAATGTAIGNAAAITEGFTYVTGSNNAAAIILPVAGIGARCVVVNTVANATLQVFPQVSSQINAKGANNVYNVPNAGQRVFTKATATLWYTDAETIV